MSLHSMASLISVVHHTIQAFCHRLFIGANLSWWSCDDFLIAFHCFSALVPSISHGNFNTVSRRFAIPISLKLTPWVRSLEVANKTIFNLNRSFLRKMGCTWNRCFVITRFNSDSTHSIFARCFLWCGVALRLHTANLRRLLSCSWNASFDFLLCIMGWNYPQCSRSGSDALRLSVPSFSVILMWRYVFECSQSVHWLFIPDDLYCLQLEWRRRVAEWQVKVIIQWVWRLINLRCLIFPTRRI